MSIEAIHDLLELKDRFDCIVESLELSSNPEFMGSYEKAKMQVRERDFADWNEL